MSLEISTSQVSGSHVAAGQIRWDHAAELDAIARFRRVTNYLAAAQIYLKDNVMLEEPLKYEYVLVDFRCYIQEKGLDPSEITNWQWS